MSPLFNTRRDGHQARVYNPYSLVRAKSNSLAKSGGGPSRTNVFLFPLSKKRKKKKGKRKTV